MATTTPTLPARQTLTARWERIKPRFWALVIGLIAGPIISNFAGLQTLSSTASQRVLSGVAEAQAMICDARARAEVADPSKLDWSDRNKLAEKFAIMPGATTATYEVTNLCSRKLSA